MSHNWRNNRRNNYRRNNRNYNDNYNYNYDQSYQMGQQQYRPMYPQQHPNPYFQQQQQQQHQQQQRHQPINNYNNYYANEYFNNSDWSDDNPQQTSDYRNFQAPPQQQPHAVSHTQQLCYPIGNDIPYDYQQHSHSQQTAQQLTYQLNSETQILRQQQHQQQQQLLMLQQQQQYFYEAIGATNITATNNPLQQHIITINDSPNSNLSCEMDDSDAEVKASSSSTPMSSPSPPPPPPPPPLPPPPLPPLPPSQSPAATAASQQINSVSVTKALDNKISFISTEFNIDFNSSFLTDNKKPLIETKSLLSPATSSSSSSVTPTQQKLKNSDSSDSISSLKIVQNNSTNNANTEGSIKDSKDGKDSVGEQTPKLVINEDTYKNSPVSDSSGDSPPNNGFDGSPDAHQSGDESEDVLPKKSDNTDKDSNSKLTADELTEKSPKHNHEKFLRDNYVIIKKFKTEDIVPLANSEGMTYFFCKLCEKLLKLMSDVDTHINDDSHNNKKSEIDDKTWAKFKTENITIKFTDNKEIIEFFCEFCDKSFRKKYEVNNHIINSENHEMFKTGYKILIETLKRERMITLDDCDGKFVQYYCLFCDRYFERKRELGKHVQTDGHRNLKTAYSDQCEKFNGESIFATNSDTGFRNFYCQSCSESFDSRIAANEHIKYSEDHKKSVTHWKNFCDQIQNEAVVIKMNQKGMRSFYCIICDKLFNRPQEVNSHVNSIEHDEDRKNMKSYVEVLKQEKGTTIKDEENGVTRYYCIFCDRIFDSKSSFKAHVDVETHQQNKTDYKSIIDKLKAEKVYKFEEKGYTKYLCQSCNEYFDSRRQAEDHINSTKHKSTGDNYSDNSDPSPLDPFGSPDSIRNYSPDYRPSKLFPIEPFRTVKKPDDSFYFDSNATIQDEKSVTSATIKRKSVDTIVETRRDSRDDSKRPKTDDEKYQLTVTKPSESTPHISPVVMATIDTDKPKPKPKTTTITVATPPDEESSAQTGADFVDKQLKKDWAIKKIFAIKCLTETDALALESLVSSLENSISLYNKSKS